MKKMLLVIGSLLMAASVSAKEVVANPVVVEEVVVEEQAPVVVEEKSLNKFTVGASFLGSEKLYKTDDDTMVVLPDFDVRYERFYIKGIQVGAYLFENDMMAFSLFVDPMAGFNVEGGDMKSGYKNIDDRDAKPMFGGKIEGRNMPYGIAPAISYKGGEEGQQGDLVIARPFVVTEKVRVIPSVMASMFSSNMVDYYFGVDGDEVNKSTDKLDKEYDGDTAYMYGAKVVVEYLFNETLSFNCNTGVKQYSSEVEDSPIVEDGTTLFVGAGVKYTF